MKKLKKTIVVEVNFLPRTGKGSVVGLTNSAGTDFGLSLTVLENSIC